MICLRKVGETRRDRITKMSEERETERQRQTETERHKERWGRERVSIK
jgi:hypothetical protein